MKTHPIRNLILIIIFFAALGGAYYFVSTLDTEVEEPSSSTETTSVFTAEWTNISKVTINNPDVIEFTKEGEEWVQQLVPNDQIIQGQVEMLVKDFANMTAQSVINSQNLSEFGLQEPSSTVTIVQNDGMVTTFLIGNATPSKNMRYLKLADKDDIYTVYATRCESALKPIDDFRNKDILKIDTTKIKEVNIDGKLHVKMVERPETEAILSSWDIVEPFTHPAANDRLTESLLNHLAAFYATGFSEGLFSASDVVTIVLEDDTTHVLNISRQDGTALLRVNDNPQVYVCDADDFDFLDIKPFTAIAERLITLVNIDNVDNVDVEYQGKHAVMKMVREGENTSYFVDSVEIEESDFKTRYQAVLGIIAEDVTILTPSEQIGQIVYNLNNSDTVKIRFFEFEDRNLIARLEKSSHAQSFVVRKKNVEAMLESVQNGKN